ncbi:MAG: 2Fe-2S iron-sulfur cluster-binding protein, partial [Mesorhizobium sp.]|nr:2Fe-2S iron-sulfur cluster-binding protein [Mesorhizobium sp.]
MSPRRAATGGQIDRTRSIRFTFDGKPCSGLAGDTLASALLANGIALVGRSFKYHRPRGVMTAGLDEPNALATIIKGDIREANVPATQIEIFDGLEVVSQNRFPSLGLDVGAVNQLGGKILSAGFYYKTFMGPVYGPLKGTRFWMFCEKFIRRAAGLGRAGYARDTARYEHMNAFCDVLVVGSGEAGLAAARDAAATGGRVILAETEPRLGGFARWSGGAIEGRDAAGWVDETVFGLSELPNVR